MLQTNENLQRFVGKQTTPTPPFSPTTTIIQASATQRRLSQILPVVWFLATHKYTHPLPHGTHGRDRKRIATVVIHMLTHPNTTHTATFTRHRAHTLLCPVLYVCERTRASPVTTYDKQRQAAIFKHTFTSRVQAVAAAATPVFCAGFTHHPAEHWATTRNSTHHHHKAMLYCRRGVDCWFWVGQCSRKVHTF